MNPIIYVQFEEGTDFIRADKSIDALSLIHNYAHIRWSFNGCEFTTSMSRGEKRAKYNRYMDRRRKNAV